MLLFGNYKNSSTSAISLEIKSGKVRAYIFNSITKKTYDKTLDFQLDPDTNYTAKLSIRDGKLYFGLLNVSSEFVTVDNIDIKDCEFGSFYFFKDNRDDKNTFSEFCLIKYCVIYSNFKPKNVFVPISRTGQAGMYDLQNNKAFLDSGIDGYITEKVEKEIVALSKKTSTENTAEVEKLNTEIKSLKEKLSTAEANNVTLLTENTNLKTDKTNLNKSISSLLTTTCELNDKIILSENLSAKLSKDISELTLSNNNLTEKLNKALNYDLDGDGKRTEADGIYLIKNIIDPEKYPL